MFLLQKNLLPHLTPTDAECTAFIHALWELSHSENRGKSLSEADEDSADLGEVRVNNNKVTLEF